MGNNEFFKKHVIVASVPESQKTEEKLVKEMAAGKPVKMVDLARAMGIDVVEF